MRSNNRLGLAGGIVAIIGLTLGGCSSSNWFGGSKSRANLNTTSKDAKPAAQGTVAQSGPSNDGVDFEGARTEFTGDRTPGIIGIYGETISRSRTVSGFGDGAANVGQVTFAREGRDNDPDVDPTGQWIVFSSTQHRTTADLYKKSVGGSTITQLTSDPADDIMPEFSPDGEWIAFCSNKSGNYDVYIMPTAGGAARVISNDPSHEVHPSWSPDGRELVYCRYGEQSQRWELWTVDVTNTSVRNFVDYGFLPEWSPDPTQNKIVFQRARERGSRFFSIWTIDYVNGQGRNPTEIVSAANAGIINPSWSPDGSRIVFASIVEPDLQPTEQPAEADIWMVQLDGTDRVNLTNGYAANIQPTWGKGGYVYFVSDRAGIDNLWRVSTGTAGTAPANAEFANILDEN